MSAPLAFGPGEKARGHGLPEARDRCALALEYGKEAVRYVDASPCYAGAVGVVSAHRREFDAWYRRDDRTPPAKVAQIIYQHARRLGATPEAVQFLRQFVTISNEEAKTMTTTAENNAAAKPNFGAPAPKKSVAEAKPPKAAATKETAAKAAAPKAEKAAAPKAEKAKSAPAKKAEPKAAPAKKAEPKAVAEPATLPATYPKPTKDEKSGAYIRRLIQAEKFSPDQIVLIVHEHFEGSKAGKSDVSWNRGKLIKDGWVPTKVAKK